LTVSNKATREQMPHENNKGSLYVVATPIGNLEDITLRAIRILKEVSLIAAEDTRHTLKLLNHYEIKNRLISLNADAERSRIPEILSQIEGGESVAVVTDAGTPAASDPGGALVAEALRRGVSVLSIPGPSAIIAALSTAGVTSQRFMFEGFLPRSGSKRAERIKAVSAAKMPVVIFESPRRINETLVDLAAALGNRKISAHREMTKHFEETHIIDLAEFASKGIAFPEKGEYTLIVMEESPRGAGEADEDSMEEGSASLEKTLEILSRYGLSARDSAAAASELLGIPKRTTYKAVNMRKSES
jgi:16S rRNA (cytidine1402-2'-O)-methyltransferase